MYTKIDTTMELDSSMTPLNTISLKKWFHLQFCSQYLFIFKSRKVCAPSHQITLVPSCINHHMPSLSFNVDFLLFKVEVLITSPIKECYKIRWRPISIKLPHAKIKSQMSFNIKFWIISQKLILKVWFCCFSSLCGLNFFCNELIFIGQRINMKIMRDSTPP